MAVAVDRYASVLDEKVELLSPASYVSRTGLDIEAVEGIAEVAMMLAMEQESGTFATFLEGPSATVATAGVSSYEKRAARAVALRHAGWGAPAIGRAAGVTRMTVSNWLASVIDTPISDRTWDDPLVVQPALDLRTAAKLTAAEDMRLAGVRGRMPDELVLPVRALWHIAVRQKNPIARTVPAQRNGADVDSASTDSDAPVVIDLTAGGEHDPSTLTTSDALDLLLMLLVRRGVTVSSIARSAGLTHRGVLDRIQRARIRGRLLDPEEEYVGDFELCSARTSSADVDPSRWVSLGSLNVAADLVRWMCVSPTHRRPADDATCEITPNLMFSAICSATDAGHVIVQPRSRWEAEAEPLSTLLSRLGFVSDVSPEAIRTDESLWLTTEQAVIDKLVVSSQRPAVGERAPVYFVPEHLLCLSGRVAGGKVSYFSDRPLPVKDILQAVVPAAFQSLFAGETESRCFTEPEAVIAENPRPALHKPDAKTRRAQRHAALEAGVAGPAGPAGPAGGGGGGEEPA